MIGQSRRLTWAGGEHDFCYRIGELRALEQRRDAGIGVIIKRMLSIEWYVDDVLEVLRLGLIGGGMSDKDARLAIERSYDHINYMGLAIQAANILSIFVNWPTGAGADDPTAGESQAATGSTTDSSRSPTENTAGPTTSAPLQ